MSGPNSGNSSSKTKSTSSVDSYNTTTSTVYNLDNIGNTVVSLGNSGAANRAATALGVDLSDDSKKQIFLVAAVGIGGLILLAVLMKARG